MAILFKSGAGAAATWRREVLARLPGEDWREWPEVGDPDDIEFVLLFRAEPGMFRRFRNLKAILATGAGVDGILADPDLPRDVPMARIVDPAMTQQMVQWTAYGVLHFHRWFAEYREQQARAEWRELETHESCPPVVGVLGCGEIGSEVARGLARLGFEARGWTRGPRDLGAEIRSYHGADGLDAMLDGCWFLICLLPLTPDTRGILNRDLFARMPRGAHVVNLARGGHLVQDDLLAALDSGQLRGAVLDVTDPEPLPAAHPLWRHPRVLLTPHVAGMTTPETAAAQVVVNIERVRAGEPLINAVDPARGY